MFVIFILNIIFIIMLLIGLGLLLYSFYKGRQNRNLPKEINQKNPSIAILIPARYESKVIQGLFTSIQNQTVVIKREDVYVVVESENDPTVELTHQFGGTTFIRKHVELQRKGYALDEVVKEILKQNKHYDLYFIMDADNMMKEDFIEKMLSCYQKGYDISLGYRNCKNGNENVIAACSGLTFTMLNTIMNKHRIKHQANVILSGTGLYIKGDLIEKWQGFPFHALTEDYEMTLYSILEGITTFYNEEAEFFDEQPITYKESKIQRIRWIKGFLESRKDYVKKFPRKDAKNRGEQISERIGIKPYIIMVIAAISFLINNVVGILLFRKTISQGISIGLFLGMILLIYSILWTFTLIMLLKEKNKINLNLVTKWKVLFYNPLFLATYVPCIIKALFQKNIGWKKVEHHTTEIQ